LYFQCVHSLCKICTILNENLLSYRLHKLDILLVFGMEGLTTQVKNTLVDWIKFNITNFQINGSF
jgi:hypothetical protein